MSPWFRRRGRRAADGGGAPEPEVEHGPEPAHEAGAEAAEPANEAGAEAAEAEGAISPTRLDQALDRLRHEIPARDDGSRPAAQ